jgi:hypothetical protein
MTNILHKAVEKLAIHILCPITFSPENLSVYEITRKNIVEWGRPQMTIWHMRIASWISKATNTHTHTHMLCNTDCFSTLTTVARTRLNITLYVLTLSVLYILRNFMQRCSSRDLTWRQHTHTHKRFQYVQELEYKNGAQNNQLCGRKVRTCIGALHVTLKSQC